MAVVIDQVEVVPAPEEPVAPAPSPALPAPPAVDREIERVARLRATREARQHVS